MFEKARIKLTMWYLLMIMVISVFFSLIIYVGANREFDRLIRFEDLRLFHPEQVENYIQRPVWDVETLPLPTRPNPKLIQATKLRMAEGLGLINLLILAISSFAGYFLAGRTLRPIKEMVDEQNRFITDASHELNTPLTSIRTNIEVNLRDRNFNLEKARGVLISNLEDVSSLQILSDELIKLNQYQKVNGGISFEKINLQEIIIKSIEKVNKQAQKKRIKINNKISKTIVLGDGKSLIELFVILLDNSIKYSKNNKNIYISSQKHDLKLQIIVEDQGIGIAKEDLPFIFERFYRAEKSRTKNEAYGYGLGLSIAKRIVTIHNGNITVDSEIGKGTKFIINLDIA